MLSICCDISKDQGKFTSHVARLTLNAADSFHSNLVFATRRARFGTSEFRLDEALKRIGF